MTALIVILAIILFFVLLLSIKFKIEAEYFDEFKLKVKWLFVEISIYPLDEKIVKLLNKKPKDKMPQEKPAEQEETKQEEEAITQKENPFKKFYNNQGFDGVIELVNNGADALGSMMKGIKKHFVIDDMYLWVTVAKSHDAAGTALEYGNICQKIFPSMGYICSNFNVRRYDIDINPDFIGTLSSAKFVFNCSLRPLFLINTLIAFAFKFLFNVVFKFLFSKPKKDSINNELQNTEGGAIQ
jgi:hypothetical protein